jgi:hypothetical protein
MPTLPASHLVAERARGGAAAGEEAGLVAEGAVVGEGDRVLEGVGVEHRLSTGPKTSVVARVPRGSTSRRRSGGQSSRRRSPRLAVAAVDQESPALVGALADQVGDARGSS